MAGPRQRRHWHPTRLLRQAAGGPGGLPVERSRCRRQGPAVVGRSGEGAVVYVVPHWQSELSHILPVARP